MFISILADEPYYFKWKKIIFLTFSNKQYNQNPTMYNELIHLIEHQCNCEIKYKWFSESQLKSPEQVYFEEAMQRLEPQERPTNREEMKVLASKNLIMGSTWDTIRTREFIFSILDTSNKIYVEMNVTELPQKLLRVEA